MTQSEMRQLTRSLRTQADKIRALGRVGVRPADIGRFLGIRYQQAYNVLKRSGMAPGVGAVRDTERGGASAPAKAVVDEAGRILLPNRVVEAWGVSPGDELLVRLEGDELRVLTRSAGLRVAREVLRKYSKGGHGMADELLAERRRGAERDDD